MAKKQAGAALAATIDQSLLLLDEEQQDHFNTVVQGLIACYLNPKLHGMVLIGQDEADDADSMEIAHIMSINTTDIHAVRVMAAGQSHIGTLVMSDAPPRELFN